MNPVPNRRHFPGRCPRLGTSTLVSLLVGFAVLGGCTERSPTEPNEGVEIALRQDTVRLAPDAAPAASRIAAVHSMYGSIRGANGVLPTSDGGLVVAANASGDALFLAYPGRQAAMEIGPRSSALAAVGMLLRPPFVPEADASRYASRIENHPEFNALVAAIAAEAAAGRSFLDSDAHRRVGVIAGAITAEAATSQHGVPVGSRSSTGPAISGATNPAKLPNIPVLIQDKASSPDYLLKNESYIPYAVMALREHGVNDPRPDTVGRMTLKSSEVGVVSWLLNESSTVTLTGVEGWGRVVVGQNAETRSQRHAQVLVDMIELTFSALGLPSTKGPVAVAVETISKTFPVLPVALLKDETWQETAERIVGQFITDQGMNVLLKALGTAFYKSLGPDVAGKVVLTAAVKNTVGSVFKYSALGYDIATKVPFYLHWAKYGALSESVTVCQENGVMVRCVGSMAIHPSSCLTSNGVEERITIDIAGRGRLYSGVCSGLVANPRPSMDVRGGERLDITFTFQHPGTHVQEKSMVVLVWRKGDEYWDSHGRLVAQLKHREREGTSTAQYSVTVPADMGF
jgi:hypothetical protein